MHSKADVTRLLIAMGSGDGDAVDRIMPILYTQLREMARMRLRGERPDHTLNATALVHEAYLKLVDIKQVKWSDRAHFLAMASTVMRRILIDYANQRRAIKRGGGAPHEELDESLISDEFAAALLDLEDSLKRLEAEHPRIGLILQHRYFGGLTNEDIARALDVSTSTIERELRFGRAWLAREFGIRSER